jgi:adenosylcobinamide-GDP ribazoletransferase
MRFAARLWNELQYLLIAIQFLTRIPVPTLARFEQSWLDLSSAYFPVAGFIVGVLSAATFYGASLVWPLPICAALAIGVGIAATGAFHEDGLADTADGLGGGWSPSQRLLIMKDSRIGTYGACALLIALALKIAALAAMSPVNGALALLAAHTGARAVPVVASAWLPYAGDVEGAKVAPIRPTPRRVMFAVVTGLIPFLVLPGTPALMALCIGFAAATVVFAKALRLIGGHTGDVLGAAEQVFEVAVLVVLAGNWG